MTLAAQGISSSLASLSEEQVAWTAAAARALNLAGYRTKVLTSPSRPQQWYLGEAFAFAPLSQCVPTGAATDTLMDHLDANEALLTQIEQAIGLAAEFSDYGELPAGLATIQLSKGDELQCLLAVQAHVSSRTPAAGVSPGKVSFHAARLSVDDAEAIGPGDMIVLERGPWLLAGHTPSLLSGPLGFAPESGRIAPILGNPHSSLDGRTLDPPVMSEQSEIKQLQVPVAIHLGEIAVTQADIDQMLKRGAFDLGAVSEGMHASLSIGGRSIGHGEIVRLGDRFAVLLAEPAQTASAQASTADEQSKFASNDSVESPDFNSFATTPENE